MILELKNFEKKINRKKLLKLDFFKDDIKSLAVIDDGINNFLLTSIQLKTKYKGQIFINDIDIKSIPNYMPLTISDFDFYEEFTVIQNILNILKIADLEFNKDEIQKQLTNFKIDYKQKYKKLAEFEKEIVKIYFLTLISKNLILLDFTNSMLTDDNFPIIKQYLIDYIANNEIIAVIFTKTINVFSNLCDDVLVISNNEFSYFGRISDLNVVKELTIIELGKFDIDSISLSLDVDYKLLGNKIIVRKSDVEKVMYMLVSSGLEIISVSDFNENTYLFDC